MIKTIAPHESIMKIVQIIIDAVQPQKIVLFGSFARGDANQDSDVDLLVTVDNIKNKRQISKMLYQLTSGSGLSKDFVVITPEDELKYRNTNGYIIQTALAEGQVLYESGR